MHAFFFQGEDGIRDLVRSRGREEVYKGQEKEGTAKVEKEGTAKVEKEGTAKVEKEGTAKVELARIHI